MKKLFCFIAIALLVMGLASPVFAAANTTAYAGGTGLGTVRTVTCINTDYSGYDETNISATSYVIPASCEIIGYHAQVLGAQSEGMFSLVDKASTSTGDADTMIISENEATNAYPVAEVYPKGVRVTRGLTIRQGPRTVVSVYYVQVKP